MTSRSLATMLALAALALLPVRARAYERATVTGDPTTPLAWPRRELGVRIADETSEDLTPVEVRDAIARSLATWTRAGGCTDVVLTNLGAPSDDRTNLLGGAHDGENRVVFREDAWPPDLGPETLAITTVVFRRSTGEILDADIDVNGVDHRWSVDDVPPAGLIDLENTMTHEVGHLLGFAHVEDPEATMFAQSDPGDIVKRDLSDDDVAGICDVYPASQRTPGGAGARPPLTSACTASVSRAGASGAASCITLATLLALAIRRRLRRS